MFETKEQQTQNAIAVAVIKSLDRINENLGDISRQKEKSTYEDRVFQCLAALVSNPECSMFFSDQKGISHLAAVAIALTEVTSVKLVEDK